MNNRSLRFARRMGESYPCPLYANPIEGPQQGRKPTSRTYWICGVAFLLLLWGIS
jgi:hypothetical protein